MDDEPIEYLSPPPKKLCMESSTEYVFCLSSNSSDEDKIFPSDTQEDKQCGDETVVINAVHTPPAMIVRHSSDDNS